MNTPLQDDDSDLRYAEYVLGVLEADARVSVEREMVESDAAAAAVAAWRRRLLPLAAEINALEPPPQLWQRIRTELRLDAPVRDGRPARLWENVRLWHWLSLTAGAIAAACIVALFLVARRPAAPAIPYMAATLAQKSGSIGWTATMDIKNARIIIVPAAPQSLAAGGAPELWLIAKGEKPIAIGMISSTAPIALPLAGALLQRVGPTAVLAVSVEPPGGSPTGQPTGPVIATGAIASAGAQTSG
ncbi:MAG TPA: anti-sigma factor [Steroidobacteraceae bacterium]|nr:anti-sigma factor [Steroidobacteraceae bacterium]